MAAAEEIPGLGPEAPPLSYVTVLHGTLSGMLVSISRTLTQPKCGRVSWACRGSQRRPSAWLHGARGIQLWYAIRSSVTLQPRRPGSSRSMRQLSSRSIAWMPLLFRTIHGCTTASLIVLRTCAWIIKFPATQRLSPQGCLCRLVSTDVHNFTTRYSYHPVW